MGVAVLEEGQLLYSQVINLKRCRPVPVLLKTTRRALDRLAQLFRLAGQSGQGRYLLALVRRYRGLEAL